MNVRNMVLRKDDENWIDICVMLFNHFLFTWFEMKNLDVLG